VVFGRSLLVRALVVGLLALGVRLWCIGLYHVTSESMEPALMTGDWLVVNKAGTSWNRLSAWTLGRRQSVMPGEIVAATVADPETSAPTVVVKRIVAVGGDTVMMRGGQLFVNGRRRDEASSVHWRHATDEASASYAWQLEFGLIGAAGEVAPRIPTSRVWGPILVPHSMVMLLGDNRASSVDGRVWGFTPEDALVGRVARVLSIRRGSHAVPRISLRDPA
jgi:signal peptidase I